MFDKLTVALETPWQITWVENSTQTIALFLILYGGGVAVYYSTKPKLREGEEHGSAKWGSPRQLNSQLAQ
ncbi:MAG: type IV secretory system conjugative DNA transfer family protein, partial [Oscillospiraceae bacterium]|nr:type IV secretory system conjugative DNA transfer family protein [Oscillospiraceae bacterium]